MTPGNSDDHRLPSEGELLDLDLENRNLETEIKLRWAGEMRKTGELDPVIENEFLKHVIAYEEMDQQPKRPMRSLFPDDYAFPPAESLSEEDLRGKLDEIEAILDQNGVGLGFADKLPDRLVYKYLTEEVIPHDEVFPEGGHGFHWTIDGCTGGCDECFQKEYCETGRELGKD